MITINLSGDDDADAKQIAPYLSDLVKRRLTDHAYRLREAQSGSGDWLSEDWALARIGERVRLKLHRIPVACTRGIALRVVDELRRFGGRRHG